MSATNIKERVQAVFREVFQDNSLRIQDSTSIDEIEAWDSIEHINLVYGLEKEFQIRFDSSEIGDFRSVGELIEILEKKLPS